MKCIAVSLGSLSLVLMQNATAESSELLSTDATEMTQVEFEQDLMNQELSDSSNIMFEELDDDLLSLDQEFEDDLEFDDPQNDSSLIGDIEIETQLQADMSASAISSSDADPILADNSLEDRHTPLNEQQALENATIENLLPMTSSAESTQSIALSDQNTELFSDESDEMFDSEYNSAQVDTTDKGINTLDSNESMASETSNISSQIQSNTKVVTLIDHKPIEVSVRQIFSGSPTIYLTLLALSVFAVTLWLLNLITLKKFAFTNFFLMKNIRNKLMSNQYDEAISICKSDNSFFAKMMLSAVNSRKYGLQFMLESMKSEGKRASVGFWQRLSLIHDIAIIAPLIGLLGTVLGMLYAFYDLNRSIESISTLFDGLGVSVGTTVSGIFVAILAMVLHSIAKYRLVKSLTFVENEAVALAHLIDNKQNQ